MKRTLFWAAFFLGSWLPAGGSCAAALVDAKAPYFEGRDLGGELRRLSDYSGKIVVLEWSSPECPYSRRYVEEGTLDAIQDHAKKNGVVWINVVPRPQALTSEQVEEQWASAKKMLILDSALEISAAYGVAATPQIFVIDRQGVLVYSGAVDSSATFKKTAATVVPYVRNALDDLLVGREVGKKITRAFGCYIPYDVR